MRLPEIDPVAVDRLTRYLHRQRPSQRQPSQSARVIQLMVGLWALGREFPTRLAVARHCRVSVPTVDLVLRRHRTGELAIVYEAGAPVVRGRRWIVPSASLMAEGTPQGVPSRRAERRYSGFTAGSTLGGGV